MKEVLLVTSVGDFDIELWSKEAPKACRNFVQLCLENYYDNLIFHRVVPSFIVQGGDPKGDGTGGESIYGKPFKDEFHSRLRFVRRGLVAMANAGKDDNGSQFFFTLGPCEDLQNKHTIFGKVSGETLYNLPRFEEGIIGENERPEYPHKIIRTEVLKNPFDDIYPRVKIENEVIDEKKSKSKGTKNFKLLSFGDEAEEEEEEAVIATQGMSKRGNSAHDIASDPTLSADVSVDGKVTVDGALERIKKKLKRSNSTEIKEPLPMPEEPESLKGTAEEKPDVSDALFKESEAEREKKKAETQAEIKRLKKELTGKTPKEKIEETTETPKEVISETIKEYQDIKSMYAEKKSKIPAKGASRESQTLALLERFAKKVKEATHKLYEQENDKEGKTETVEKEKEGLEETGEDEGWLSHRLYFDNEEPILAKDANTKDNSWYSLDDPRHEINQRRRAESARKKKKEGMELEKF